MAEASSFSDHDQSEGEEVQLMQQEPAFIIRLCSDGAAYEAVPRRKLKIDMTSIRRSLEHAGNCEITLWTPQLMVIKKNDATEITIVDDGRLIIRNVADQEAAQRITEALLSELLTNKR